MNGDVITLTCGECGEQIIPTADDLRACHSLRMVSPFYMEVWCEQCQQIATFVHKTMTVKEVCEWIGTA